MTTNTSIKTSANPVNAGFRKIISRVGLRTSVILICLVSCAALWVGFIVQFNFMQQTVIEARARENDNLATLLNEHIEETLRTIELIIDDISASHRFRGRQFDIVEYSKRRAINSNSIIVLRIVDKHGDTVQSTRPTGLFANFRETDNYQHHLVDTGSDIFVGQPRLAANTKGLASYISKRMNKGDGSFGGYVVVGIDPSYFSRLYAALDLGLDSTITIMRRDGVVLARDSNGAISAGENLANTSLFNNRLPTANQGNYIGPSPVDHVTRIYSYRALKHFPLVVLIGTSKAGALQQYDEQRIFYIQACLVATLIILLLGVLAVAMITRSRRDHHFAATLIDTAPAIMVMLDAKGMIKHVNPHFEKVTGYRADEVKGTEWFAFLPARDRSRIRRLFLNSLRYEPVRGSINPIVTRSGEEREIEWHDQVTRDFRGAIDGILAFGQDVTDRQRSETKVKEAQALLQTVLDSTPDWIFAKDKEYRLLFANRAVAAAQGLQPENMVGRRDHEVWPEEYCFGNPAKGLRGFRVDDDRALAGESVRILNDVAPLADGTERILDTLILPLRDASGRIYGVLGYGRDITEQKRLERALQVSASRLQESQRIAMIGSWDLNIASGALAWSDQIFQIFEIDKKKFDATYAAFLNAIHPEDREKVNTAYTNSLKTRERYAITHRLLMPDGRIKYVHERCESEFDQDGNPSRSLGTVQDITALREREMALFNRDSRLRALVENAPYCIHEIDQGGRFAYMNPTGLRMLNADGLKDVIGMHFSSLIHPHHQKNIDALFSEALQGKRSEFEFESSAGNYYQSNFIPLSDSGGKISRVIGITIDISGRVKSTEEIRITAERLAQAQRISRLGYLDWDLVTNHLTLSEETLAIFRLDGDKQSHTLDEITALLPADEKDRVEKSLQAATMGLAIHNMDHRMICPDGTEIYVRAIAELIRDKSGKPARLLGTVRDITARIRGVLALQESQSLLSNIIGSAMDAIVTVDENYRILVFNRAAEAMFGCQAADVIGGPLERFIPERLRAAHAAHMQAFSMAPDARAKDLPRQINALRADGSEFPVESTIAFAEAGGKKLFTVMLRDIIGRITAAEAQRDTLVKEVHHRIKNNLQGVIGLARQHVATHPELKTLADEMIAKIRVIAVVHGLQSEGLQGEITLCELVTEISNAATAITQTPINTFVLTASPNSSCIARNESVPLALVLNELIYNAIKHRQNTGTGGGIEIQISGDSHKAQVTLSNEGTLPGDFDYELGRGVSTGLCLIKALLPRHGASLSIVQQDGRVVATLILENL